MDSRNTSIPGPSEDLAGYILHRLSYAYGTNCGTGGKRCMGFRCFGRSIATLESHFTVSVYCVAVRRKGAFAKCLLIQIEKPA